MLNLVQIRPQGAYAQTDEIIALLTFLFIYYAASRRPPGMQDHISLRQRGWSGRTPSLPL